MEKFRGTLCDICTGCGRCVGEQKGIRVIADSFLLPKTNRLIQRQAGFLIADVGTTTLAMEAYDSKGIRIGRYVRENPQRFFGADVISRIQASSDKDIRKELEDSLRLCLEEGCRILLQKAKEQGVLLAEGVLAGNTTMMYFLLGHDTDELGRAPFHAESLKSEEATLSGIPFRTVPGCSAFVGGDITAGILACEMDRAEELSLLIDLGTNGEMVLGNREKLLGCATAAGPAFEGKCGDEEEAVWGADLIHLTARLLAEGILDETGLLEDVYFEKGILVEGVRISQGRIRALQNAKAAIAAGIECLAKAYGLRELDRIGRVFLAGGFGYFLNVESAVLVGLLPELFLGRTMAVGNTALAGAYCYVNSKENRLRADLFSKRIRIRNLAEDEEFSQRFPEAMYLRRC